ncbi:MAG: mechanosensitive ion channel [Rhodobacteraceae bacterium]|nr:mechanosensitive ion channel [Paracoccaceae bacterium]
MNFEDVNIDAVNTFIENYLGVVIGAGLNILYAIVILLAAMWLGGVAKRRLQVISRRYEQIDDTLFDFLGTVIRYAILIMGLIFVLNRFGIQTASLVALLGAAGLAVGLALQGTLSNIAAGVMVVIFRPFKLGDFIDAGGQMGTVKTISLFTTELASLSNTQIILPNSEVWGRPIVNYSVYKTRRAEWVFGVSYGADLKKAEEIIRDTIMSDPRAHKDPEPFIQVNNLGDFSVDFLVRVWCNSGDFFAFQADMKRKVKEALDAGGIEIPFPTRTVLQAAE